MGRLCVVVGCPNNRARSKDGQSIHSFPHHDPEIRKTWVDVANTYGRKLLYKNYGFCCRHFAPHDYNRHCQSKKKALWDWAVPTISLALPIVNTVVPVEHVNDFEFPEETIPTPLAMEVDRESDLNANENIIQEGVQSSKDRNVPSQDSTGGQAPRTRRRVKRRHVVTGNLNVLKLKSKIKILEGKLRNAQKLISKKNSLLKKKKTAERKLSRKEKSRRKLKMIEEAMAPCFSKNQVKLTMGMQKRVRWNYDEITKAVALHAQLGSKSYNYLRSKGPLPYPALSTLQRWAKGLDFRPGELMQPVLKMMNDEFKSSTPLRRLAVLGFDEVDISGDYCLDSDKQKEQIYGAKTKMLLVCVRGLCSSWKQIVYFDLDGHVTKDKILNIVQEVENSTGIKIVAMVNDMDPKNMKVWKELGVTLENTYFTHPCDSSKKIYVFADYPHLLKLLKSHLFDDGYAIQDFETNSVVEVRGSCIEGILAAQKSDLRICPKLTAQHATAKKKERQRVRPAFELFSNTVANAIVMLQTGDKRVGSFFATINNYSDLMNTSSSTESQNVYKSPYGYNISIQNKLIDDVENIFLNMRVGKFETSSKQKPGANLNNNGEEQQDVKPKRGRKKSTVPKPPKKPALKPFQRGFIINGRSLRSLFQDLKYSDANVKYILTRMLTQDYIEHSFGRFRGFGHGNVKPNAVDAIARVKKLIICINSASTRNANVELSPGDEGRFLSSTLLQPLLEISKDQLQKSSNDCDRIECFEGEQQEEKGMDTLEREQREASDVAAVEGVQQEMMNTATSDGSKETEASATVATSSRSKTSESAGQQYVAGYIAKKFPLLGFLKNDNPDENTWISHLSSKLIQPSDEWNGKFKIFEEMFNSHHKTENRKVPNVNMNPKPIQSLCNTISCKFPDFPKPVIEFYCKTRTIMRIKNINRDISNETALRYLNYEKRKKQMIARPRQSSENEEY